MQIKNISNFFIWTDDEIFEEKSYNSHYHEFYQVSFCLEGEIQYNIKNKTITLKKNDILFIPPFQNHSPVGGQNPDYFKCIEMKLYLTQSLRDLLPVDENAGIIYLVPEDRFKIQELLRSILKEWRDSQLDFEKVIHSYLECMFVILKRRTRETSIQAQTIREKVVSLSERRKKRISVEIKSYIDSNYNGEINLGKLAGSLGVSQSYLSGIFKEKENISPVEYINAVKLNKAKELMKTSELNFTQIAEKAGYQNVYYFSRIFKKKNKVTPSEYRELVNVEKSTSNLINAKLE